MFGKLADVEVGAIERGVFDSPEVYREEARQVFGACWLFLAHESQLPRAGDFTTACMGEDPVIVARHTDGTIRAFLNVCRHRGMRVCRPDAGHSLRFTCSFHGWSYDTAGALDHVPMEAEAFIDGFDRADRGLLAVPRLDVHQGLIFGSWNLDAPPLEEYLGDALTFLDGSLVGSELVGPMKWQLKGNWKLAAEQICGDNYHVTISHASGIAALMAARPEFDGSRFDIGRSGIRELLTDYGHSSGYFPTFTFGLSYPDELLPYLSEAVLVSEAGEQAVASGVGTLFPNFSHISGRTIRVYHPRGPGAIEVWAWVLVGAGWPDRIKHEVVRHSQLSFSTTGVIETDDSENWNETAAAAGGLMTAEIFFDYKMRRDPLQDNDPLFPSLRGRSAGALSDEPALNFYRRWAELMDGPEPRRPTLDRACAGGASAPCPETAVAP